MCEGLQEPDAVLFDALADSLGVLDGVCLVHCLDAAPFATVSLDSYNPTISKNMLLHEIRQNPPVTDIGVEGSVRTRGVMKSMDLHRRH